MSDYMSEQWIKERMRELKLPIYMERPVIGYLVHGIMPGQFLKAIFGGEGIVQAYKLADLHNKKSMEEWAIFIHNSMPANSQGSPEAMRKWCER